MVDIRNKGKNGELTICKSLNSVWMNVCSNLTYVPSDDKPFKRNLMQFSQGGSDIVNPFGLSIEVKNHEKLDLNTWWKQTLVSAEKEKGIPILIYKQSKSNFMVMINGQFYYGIDKRLILPSTIYFYNFTVWLENYILTNHFNGRGFIFET